jgi:DNA-binding CsgD family transcriptional regulator
LPFGVVIVQHDMAVVTMNAAAEALLSRAGSPLSLTRGVLVIDPPARDLLQHHIREACRLRHGVAPGLGGDVMLRSGEGPVANFAVTVGPLAVGGRGLFVDPCAVLFVREISLGLPPGFEDQIQALFQLTPREAGLACALASGLSLKQAAAEANIRFSTARSYLDIIFRKTATKQQSQLVALLRSTQPFIRRP